MPWWIIVALIFIDGFVLLFAWCLCSISGDKDLPPLPPRREEAEPLAGDPKEPRVDGPQEKPTRRVATRPQGISSDTPTPSRETSTAPVTSARGYRTAWGIVSGLIPVALALAVPVYLGLCIPRTIELNQVLQPLADEFTRAARRTRVVLPVTDPEYRALTADGALERIVARRDAVVRQNRGFMLGAWRAYRVHTRWGTDSMISWAFCYNPFQTITPEEPASPPFRHPSHALSSGPMAQRDVEVPPSSDEDTHRRPRAAPSGGRSVDEG